MKYYRYCSSTLSPHTGQPYGIFVAAWKLVEDGRLIDSEERQYWEMRRWYEEHLPIPSFYEDGNTIKAVTWFKESVLGTEFTHRLCFYQTLLNKYGVPCEIAVTEAPGRVIYEDEFQIAVVNT